MNLSLNKTDGKLTVSVEGRLDTVTAPKLEALLLENYEATEALTFECGGLEYISSAGLRVLLTAHKRMKGKMKLTNVNEIMLEVLSMTGFADIWVIE